MADTPDILKKILEQKKAEVASARIAMPLPDLRSRIADLPATLGFKAALRKTADAAKTAIIAEVKKGSPSKGVIRADSIRLPSHPLMRKTALHVSPS